MLVFKCIFLKNNFLLFTCMTIHNMFFLIMIVASCTNYVKCSMCEKHKFLKRFLADAKLICFISKKFLWNDLKYAFLGNPSVKMIYSKVNMRTFLRYRRCESKYVLLNLFSVQMISCNMSIRMASHHCELAYESSNDFLVKTVFCKLNMRKASRYCECAYDFSFDI